jgi:hypothetical protein
VTATVLLKAGGVDVMNEEMLRLKNKAVRYLLVMQVECATISDGRETVQHVRIENPEIALATTGEELVSALVMALGRCPMPTNGSLQIRRMLADVRWCASNQA